MKIAIASEKKSLDSKVSQAVGRASYFLIFEDKILIKTIKNPFAVGGGGAGLSVVQMLSNESVEFIVGGKFGGNMIEALDNKSMTFQEVSGKTVNEFIEEEK